jgi:hypothetical protein
MPPGINPFAINIIIIIIIIILLLTRDRMAVSPQSSQSPVPHEADDGCTRHIIGQ